MPTTSPLTAGSFSALNVDAPRDDNDLFGDGRSPVIPPGALRGIPDEPSDERARQGAVPRRAQSAPQQQPQAIDPSRLLQQNVDDDIRPPDVPRRPRMPTDLEAPEFDDRRSDLLGLVGALGALGTAVAGTDAPIAGAVGAGLAEGAVREQQLMEQEFAAQQEAVQDAIQDAMEFNLQQTIAEQEQAMNLAEQSFQERLDRQRAERDFDREMERLREREEQIGERQRELQEMRGAQTLEQIRERARLREEQRERGQPEETDVEDLRPETRRDAELLEQEIERFERFLEEGLPGDPSDPLDEGEPLGPDERTQVRDELRRMRRALRESEFAPPRLIGETRDFVGGQDFDVRNLRPVREEVMQMAEQDGRREAARRVGELLEAGEIPDAAANVLLDDLGF